MKWIKKMAQRLLGVDVVRNGDHEREHHELRRHLDSLPGSTARLERACRKNTAAHAAFDVANEALSHRLDELESQAVLPNGDRADDPDPPTPFPNS